jgi:hypothetical protein
MGTLTGAGWRSPAWMGSGSPGLAQTGGSAPALERFQGDPDPRHGTLLQPNCQVSNLVRFACLHSIMRDLA